MDKKSAHTIKQKKNEELAPLLTRTVDEEACVDGCALHEKDYAQSSMWVGYAAALGSLVQGYDTGIIGAALLFIIPEFSLGKQPLVEGMVLTMSTVGAMIGTVITSFTSDKLGRRSTMRISSIAFIISALLFIWSPNVYILILARLIMGCGVGMATSSAPVFIAECAHRANRGALATIPHLYVSTGIMSALIVSFLVVSFGVSSWRLMLGLSLIPSMLQTFCNWFLLPESPHWLIKHSMNSLPRREGVHSKQQHFHYSYKKQATSFNKSDSHSSTRNNNDDDNTSSMKVSSRGDLSTARESLGFLRGISSSSSLSSLFLEKVETRNLTSSIRHQNMLKAFELELEELYRSIEQENNKDDDDVDSDVRNGWAALLEPEMLRLVFICCGLQMFQQLGGINCVIYFTPYILKTSGVPVLFTRIGNINENSATMLANILLYIPKIPLLWWR